jgi:hypothetical protein
MRAADVAEPVAVLVALQLADEFSAAGSQAGDEGVDVLDRECDVADTPRVRRRVPVVASFAGEWNFTSSRRPLPSGVCIIAKSTRTPSSPTTRSTQRPSTVPSPCGSSPSSAKNSGRGCEVVNHDADVLHPLDSHVFDGKEPDSGRGARRRRRRRLLSPATTPVKVVWSSRPRGGDNSTSQGRPYSIFKRAIQRRNVLAAVAAAGELPHLSLLGALDLTFLVARKGPARHPRVAARWLLRFLEEHPEATIEEAARRGARSPPHLVSGASPFAIRATPKTRNSTAITASLCWPSQPFSSSSAVFAFAPPTR